MPALTRHHPTTALLPIGWINCLFPYLQEPRPDGAVPKVNPWATTWRETDGTPGRRIDRGPLLDEFPTGFSRAPFKWKYLTSEFSMEFLGGFVGVSQDESTGSVRPVIGWGVAEVACQTAPVKVPRTEAVRRFFRARSGP